MENLKGVSQCSTCKLEILAHSSSKGFLAPDGQQLCFNCYINYSGNNSEKNEDANACTQLCSSILIGSPCLKENMSLGSMNFNLEACSKHIWTELKTQKLHAFTYCTVCDLCMCSVCLLSTPHRYHETLQLSEIFSNVDEIPNQPQLAKKPSIGPSVFANIAKRVIKLLSSPAQLTPEALASAGGQLSSPINNTSDGKSLFLLDVLNKETKKDAKSKEPLVNVFSLEENSEKARPKAKSNSIVRSKSPYTVNVSLVKPSQPLHKSSRTSVVASPLIKVNRKEFNSPSTLTSLRTIASGTKEVVKEYSLYKPTINQKARRHTKAFSLIPENINWGTDNKENVSPSLYVSTREPTKSIKRVISGSKTRADTPRPSSDLSNFSMGIQKAFGSISSANTPKYFVLSRMGISEKNILQLVELMKNYRIFEIDLSHNKLTDLCLPPLATVLKDQRVKIDLRGNPLSNSAVDVFKSQCVSSLVLF